MAKEIEIDPYSVIHRVLKNSELQKASCLHGVISEARVLEAVKAPMHLWLNLGRKTFDLIDEQKASEIRQATGYIIKKAKISGFNRCMHLTTPVSQPIQTRQAVALMMSSNIHLMIYRNAHEISMTAFS